MYYQSHCPKELEWEVQVPQGGSELVFHRAARDVQALGNLVVREVLHGAEEEKFVATRPRGNSGRGAVGDARFGCWPRPYSACRRSVRRLALAARW